MSSPQPLLKTSPERKDTLTIYFHHGAEPETNSGCLCRWHTGGLGQSRSSWRFRRSGRGRRRQQRTPLENSDHWRAGASYWHAGHQTLSPGYHTWRSVKGISLINRIKHIESTFWLYLLLSMLTRGICLGSLVRTEQKTEQKWTRSTQYKRNINKM